MLHPDLFRLSETLGRIFMRLTGLSWSVRYVRPPSGRAGKSRGRPVFFTFWHGRQLPLIHTHRNEGITVLVSLNRDGQYVTNVLHSMGFKTVRGSSSRGGKNAIREMVLALKQGIDCAITPDGPRGPAETAKYGIAHIARLGKRPVITVGSSAWPAVRFSSWDGFMLPLPFARVSIVEGRPVPPMKRGDDLQHWTEMIQVELNRVTACADLLASPSARFFGGVLSLLGAVLHPVSSVVLLFRPHRERKERKGYVKMSNDRPVWMHGSSLGELNGLISYAKYLEGKNVPVWITCFTPSGRSFISKMGLNGSYIPLDIPRFAERFIQRIRPRAFILAETEIWPNTVFKAVQSGIPCMMINARLSKKSLKGYRFLGSLPGKLLSCFTVILARSTLDMKRFISMGIDERIVSVSGDSKMLTDHGDPPPQWRIALKTNKPVLVAGSTRNGEEAALLKAAGSAGYFPVIAPRHLDRIECVLDLMTSIGFKPVRWSKLIASESDELDFDSVLVDVHGELARIYGVGDAAFVGGTLVRIGGHNVLEPVMRGVPLIVGPYYSSFAEVVNKLTVAGVAHIVSSEEEIADVLAGLSKAPLRDNTVTREFESIRRQVLDDFTVMISQAGIIEMDEADEKT
jgi:3-deoxy-D-manno-octulosonic-acid transferase